MYLQVNKLEVSMLKTNILGDVVGLTWRDRNDVGRPGGWLMGLLASLDLATAVQG